MTAEENWIAIDTAADVEHVRRVARTLAVALGLGRTAAEAVVIAVSELGTNLVRYAEHGAIKVDQIDGPKGPGLEVTSRDRGPGIAHVDLALRDGYSTGGGLGSGLPAVRRLMDECDIVTGPTGTLIAARKWR